MATVLEVHDRPSAAVTENMDDSGFLEPENVIVEDDAVEQQKNIEDIEMEDLQVGGDDEDENFENRACDMEDSGVGNLVESAENVDVEVQPTPCDGCIKKREKYKKLKQEVNELKAVIREYERHDKKFAVPLDCSNTVRQVYRELRREESIEPWDTGLDSRYTSELNTKISSQMVKEVKSLFPKRWPKGVIREAIRRYWQSVRDDETRTRTGKKEMHRRKVKRQSRMRRKLQCRMAAIKEIDWPEQRKERVKAVMTMDYMSSEESDDENPRQNTVQELNWETERLTRYKGKLDTFYVDVMISEKAKRQRIPAVRKEMFSTRAPPHGAPSWSVQ